MRMRSKCIRFERSPINRLRVSRSSVKSPHFLRLPYSGNLDRIQVIKGWMDAKGPIAEPDNC